MLTQTDPHATEHPGPLVAFYRRLNKRKARNVAIVATARKLVTIAYLMLKNNEPYRYAQPERVQAKLRLIRRTAETRSQNVELSNHKEREADPPDRLNRTYARNGLPPSRRPEDWSPSELRGLDTAGVTEFAMAIHVPPPKQGPKPKAVKQ